MPRTCTLKGKSYVLEGPELKAGDAAPDATLQTTLLDRSSIGETNGRVRILSVVPSLDTPVCSEQTKRFNAESANLPDVDFFTISCDLPTSMARFCGTEKIDTARLRVLSDHFNTSFGRAYGTLIRDLRIECRAVFVLDRHGIIQYAEYVPEVADHPNYNSALQCARQLAGEYDKPL